MFTAPVSCKSFTNVYLKCGTINSLNIVDEKNGDSATATVEFEHKDDTLTAQTKSVCVRKLAGLAA